MRSGAPLRFLGLVLAGWTSVRVVMLWPATIPLPMLEAAAPAEAAVRKQAAVVHRRVAERLTVLTRRGRPQLNEPLVSMHEPARSAVPASAAVDPAMAPVATEPAAEMHGEPALATSVTRPLARPVALERSSSPSRLAVDAWLVARPSGGDTLAFGQLGASQTGARVTYALDERRSVLLSARVSAPLRDKGSEAGLGIDVRPLRAPVHLLVEERFGLDGGGARPAATVVAGGSIALPQQARLDAYGQGGAVWRRGGFVDGAALVTRSVMARGAVRLEAGGGAWGAAQRRVARLDLGPSVAVIAPAGSTFLRLQLDYRLRVAGRARPGSGPALTLGGSF